MPEYHWQLRGTPLSMEKGQVRWLGERETELPLVSSSRVLHKRTGMNLRVDLGLAGRAGRGWIATLTSIRLLLPLKVVKVDR